MRLGVPIHMNILVNGYCISRDSAIYAICQRLTTIFKLFHAMNCELRNCRLFFLRIIPGIWYSMSAEGRECGYFTFIEVCF